WFSSLRGIDLREAELIERQIDRELNCPLNSSMGRLFDAVSALLGVRQEIDYEGQAAVELEMAAREGDESQECYPYGLNDAGGVKVILLSALLSAVVEDLRQHTPTGIIASKFHNTIVRMVREVCRLLSESTGVKNIALSGGVFQNRLLLPRVVSSLESEGFSVFTHRQVPCGDGGISLGQAAVASFSQEDTR
ncbi:MAG: carbamoyltransferase HypF, partial [Chloroflexota bacterium]